SYSLVMDDETISMLPTPKVEVADTVGAGDSFSGAFLAYWLRGFSLRAAHERAVEVSAFVCTQQGAWPEYPAQLQED
ncbi:MAG: carbohydrate kinase family protein, partial [Bifidobacterium dentium]